ncbi:MAG: hypothetical protein OXN17_08100 [Candidatus Poribacteria bacterium]|nr:hypothetical protein [Candidatus Poribacteria bacterium]MDE0505927.1 hypothetical protein [Candidatus Poribacteria bacterium]
MKRLLEGLTFILIGVVIAGGGNMLNYADVGAQKVTTLDEIQCRQIIVYEDMMSKSVWLEVNNDTPHITVSNATERVSFSVFALSRTNLQLKYEHSNTGMKRNEILLKSGKNHISVTQSIPE